ncbi:MAG: hypothetical protein KAH16_01185 [Candidatus Izimaplasma sp.]|nr:hypothetical protein [Candidatus Izimaplasma bacterium]
MKNIVKSIAILTLSVASMSAFSLENSMKMKQDNGAKQGMGMGMSDAMKDKMAKDKQQYILKVNDLSDRIQDEKSASKKQKLMDEQLVIIKAHQEKKRQMKKMMMKKMMMKKSSMKM